MKELQLESGYIRATVENRVLRVTLARPEKRNALTRAMYGDLIRCARHAGDNTDVDVLVLDAKGAVFCAGNDIADFINTDQTELADANNGPAMTFIRALMALDKQIVIAVQGQATGIGVTMLLHADLVVAGESARFSAAFVDIGIVPEAGSSLILPALIGRQNAARLLLAGDTFTAGEAERMGLIAYRVADDTLAEKTEMLVHRLCAKPQTSIRYTKQLMRAGFGSDDIEGQIERESKGLGERLISDETRAIMSKVLKR